MKTDMTPLQYREGLFGSGIKRGECKGAGADFERTMNDLAREWTEKVEAWVKMLQNKGVAAAHSDDGWVDRKENTVTFVYPYFMGNLQIGSIVALGDPDSYRHVRLTKKIEGLLRFSDEWEFESF